MGSTADLRGLGVGLLRKAAQLGGGAGDGEEPACRGGCPCGMLSLLDPSMLAMLACAAGRHSVDIREWYSKDGEMMVGGAGGGAGCLGLGVSVPCNAIAFVWAELSCASCFMQPGKKGIALSGEEWAKLCKAAPQLSQHLHAMGAAAPAPSLSPAAAASPVTEAGPSSGGPSDAAVELSGQRLADVSQFKGTIYCSIREYYEKVGAGGLHVPAPDLTSPPHTWAAPRS